MFKKNYSTAVAIQARIANMNKTQPKPKTKK